MGVYIKGMEMPKSCARCKLFGEYGCPFVGPVGYACTEGRRNERCPLLPIPPHGRLIDADALYEKFSRLESEAMNALKTTAVDVNWWSAILTERTGYKYDIADAPTIIPAEEAHDEIY